MRVLVVEDDVAVADGIIDGLTSAAIESHHVSTGAECLSALETYRPEIVLLDLGLPDMDGTEVCRAIRAKGTVPIIVVSARNEEIDRVLALEMGADDFLVKPFGIRELVARIRAVGRRFDPGAKSLASERRFGDLAIDLRAQRVTLSMEPIHLTAKEFELMAYLTADPGAVFRRSEILRDVWNTNWYGTTKTLDAHIAAIRKKLGSSRWIESVRGVGFRFGWPP